MHYLNQSIKGLSFFLFIVFMSILYGFCIQCNPILPINLFIWVGFILLLDKALGSTIRLKNGLNKVIGFLGILISIYFIFIAKSAYYIAYFNNIYLMESVSFIPEGFWDGLLLSILNPSVFIEKLTFLLSWDNLSLSFSDDKVLSFGHTVSNSIRFVEVLGILLSSFLWDKIAKMKKSHF